jgi:hypothetical protein
MKFEEIKEKITMICLEHNLNEIIEKQLRELCVETYVAGSVSTIEMLKKLNKL